MEWSVQRLGKQAFLDRELSFLPAFLFISLTFWGVERSSLQGVPLAFSGIMQIGGMLTGVEIEFFRKGDWDWKHYWTTINMILILPVFSTLR